MDQPPLRRGCGFEICRARFLKVTLQKSETSGMRLGYDPAVPRVLVFTATYDEVGNIEAWVAGCRASVPEADLLVIDDDSPDGTGTLLDDLSTGIAQLTVIHRARKSGLPSAHVAAICYALEHGYDLLVTMDADGSHQPHQIPALVAGSSRGGFVVGTRYRGGSHQAKRMRRTLSFAANHLTMLVLPTGLSEYTTSFRVFDRNSMEVLANAKFDAGGYAFFVECIEFLYSAGITMVEVPIDFVDRTTGRSKIPKSQVLLSMQALAILGWRRRLRCRSWGEVSR